MGTAPLEATDLNKYHPVSLPHSVPHGVSIAMAFGAAVPIVWYASSNSSWYLRAVSHPVSSRP